MHGHGNGTLNEKEDEENNGHEWKKKRHQVRIACTHCQKACKRCSDMRFVTLIILHTSHIPFDPLHQFDSFLIAGKTLLTEG